MDRQSHASFLSRLLEEAMIGICIFGAVVGALAVLLILWAAHHLF